MKSLNNTIDYIYIIGVLVTELEPQLYPRYCFDCFCERKFYFFNP